MENGVGGTYLPAGRTIKENALLACESVYGTGSCSSKACGSCNNRGYHSILVASPCNGATMWNYYNQAPDMSCKWMSCREVIVSIGDNSWKPSCANGEFHVRPTPKGKNIPMLLLQNSLIEVL